MNLEAIKLAAPQFIGRSTLIVKKYSPQILTTVGILGMGATVVMASKATLKLEATVDGINNRREAEKTKLEKDEVTIPEYQRNVAKVYTMGALDVVKLYGPTLTMGLASISCIVGAQGIMQRRQAGLIAAYKAVETSFSEYRKRVAEEIGEDQERDIRLGIREEEVKDEETGKNKTVHKFDAKGRSVYARFFDESSVNWSPVGDYNLVFLRAQQNQFNDLLATRGHVFLNDVYDALDIPRTKAGSIVGWVLSKEGDNYIDFGIYDPANEAARDFVNGHEKNILLDFNVDGVIYDKLP